MSELRITSLPDLISPRIAFPGIDSIGGVFFANIAFEWITHNIINRVKQVTSGTTAPTQPQQEEEEEDEEEDDDDDEGLVEEQLNQNDADMHGSRPASPKPSSSADVRVSSNPPTHEEQATPAPEQKRRPGRPRGSKNRRPRVGSAKHESQFQASATSTTPASTGPPSHPNITPQNQQYYEFQWRVLNLCAEFYGAAEELVKGTSPLVVAQCYHMGPGVKVDPLAMLGDAKRVCDTLLANPSQLVTNPPPPIYPVLPTIYQPAPQPPAATPVASTSTSTATPAATVAPTPGVITGAQSFVVPLGTQPGYPYATMYGAAPGQYPTTPYYHQYAAYHPGAYYAQPQPIPTAQPTASTSTAPAPTPAPAVTTTQVQPTATITTTPATGGTMIGNQGAWSDEEMEQLKKLAERSKATGTSGEIDWDWVVQEWGISRTRHQILIKATALGLKESSTRAPKRRRGEDGTDVPVMSSLQPSTSNTSNPSTTPVAVSSMASPAQSTNQSAPTPSASPALQNQQRPSSSKGPVTAAPAPKMPWPMPTVAVSTVPVITTPATTHEQQRTSYYRPRPNQTDSSGKTTPTATGPISHQQPVTHQYMYTPNGQASR
ncbi:unnamed protein product [Cyclocybe aegerita]|uniref:Myb-like domain-containing protein n=1 Tax=Cyclocybe aegerita TaxID=1973307 RepID=A0A8S0VSI0_CYCAE|nr:unnamed protein product [Cyclocybe aegerita]